MHEQQSVCSEARQDSRPRMCVTIPGVPADILTHACMLTSRCIHAQGVQDTDLQNLVCVHSGQ